MLFPYLTYATSKLLVVMLNSCLWSDSCPGLKSELGASANIILKLANNFYSLSREAG